MHPAYIYGASCSVVKGTIKVRRGQMFPLNLHIKLTELAGLVFFKVRCHAFVIVKQRCLSIFILHDNFLSFGSFLDFPPQLYRENGGMSDCFIDRKPPDCNILRFAIGTSTNSKGGKR